MTDRPVSEPRRRVGLAALQVMAWLAAWAFWVVVNRRHHPTLAIDVVATGCLMAGCAVAVYAHQMLIRPRFRGRTISYFTALMTAMIVATVASVFAIMWVYDRMWGPDPARYGLGFNLATDFAGVVVHVVLAATIVWVVSRGALSRNV